jgi:hypothetical protein
MRKEYQLLINFYNLEWIFWFFNFLIIINKQNKNIFIYLI